jgi:hypothetical protein
MKVYGEVEVKLHLRLTPEIDAGEWSVSHFDCFTPRGKSHRHPLYRRVSDPQGWFGRTDEYMYHTDFL